MTVQSEILTLIKSAKTIIIQRHQRPDPDAIGSQLGLADIIKTSFPAKRVLTPGKQYHGFDWLGQMDEVTEADYHDALVLVLDTANQPRVDGEFYATGKTLVKIDHHPNDDAFGDPQWVDVDASSTSELIYEFYAANADELMLTANAARLLYAGIVGDTGRFLYSATKPSTMRAAAALMEAGADATAVNRIEDTITLPVARLSAYVYEHLTQLDSGAAYVILTNDIMDSFEIGDASTAGVVPLPGRIDTVAAWAIFVQQKEGDFRIRLRSKGPAINELAKLHDGGGHPMASGAKAADQQEIEQVVRELDQVARQYKKEV